MRSPKQIHVTLTAICSQCERPIDATLDHASIRVEPCANCMSLEYERGKKDLVAGINAWQPGPEEDVPEMEVWE